MDYNLLTVQMYNGLFQGFKIVLDMAWPYLLPIFIGGIIATIIKKVFKSFTYNFELVTGSTKRQAKKKAKYVGDFIDLFSAMNDFFNKK